MLSWSYVGQICPTCEGELRPGDDIYVCSQCECGYHRSCYNGSRVCLVEGCSNARLMSGQEYPHPDREKTAVSPQRSRAKTADRDAAKTGDFHIGQALNAASSLTLQRFGFMLLLTIVSTTLWTIPYWVAQQVAAVEPVLGFMFHTVDLFITSLILISVYSIWLRVVDGQPASLGDMFSLAHLGPRYFAVTIVTTILFTIGFVLFIIPGIVLMLQYAFAGFAIVERNAGVFDALSISSQLTRGLKLKLFRFGLLLMLSNLGGLLLLEIGLLFTIPMSFLAYTHVYRQLTASTEN